MTTTQPTGRMHRMRRGFADIVPPLIVFLVVIAAWYVVSYLVLDPAKSFLLPPPHEVIIEGFFAEKARADVLAATWETAKVAIIGLVVNIVCALILGIFLYRVNELFTHIDAGKLTNLKG